MALTALAIPSQMGLYNSPVDAAMEFTASETLTATGYMGSATTTVTLDLGGANPVSAVGRHEGIWNILISAITLADQAADPSYRAFLLGSNDAAFGNGNVELLAFHDLGFSSAERIIPTILGATPAIPATNKAGTQLQKLFTNQSQGLLYRYLRGYWVIAGTTPSVAYRSWISKADVKV